MEKSYIAVNDIGYRIGQDHPKAKLTDIEVGALIRDRGPEEKPSMSLSQLAKRYGMSKSGVAGILNGRRRGQATKLVEKPKAVRVLPSRERKVRVNLRVSLRARALLHRLGGGRWIDSVMVRVAQRLERARSLDEDQALERVLEEIGVSK